MTRIGRSAIIVTVANIVATATALGAAPAAQAATPSWRIGADLSLPWSNTLPLYYLGSLGGLGGLAQAQATGTSVGLEARVADAWWLLFDVDASYSEHDESTYKVEAAMIGGGLGVRVRVAQMGPVMLSTALRADAHYGWGHQVSRSEDLVFAEPNPENLSVSLRVGLAVDVALTDALDVRLASDVGQLTYLTSPAGDGVQAGLDLRPTIGLGARF
jgi:hypothetical protein